MNPRPDSRRLAVLAAWLCLLGATPLAWPQGLVLPPQAVPAGPQAPRPKGPTTIDAEKIEGVAELEVTARGRVEFQREDLTIYSEFLRFNQEFGRVEADGGVRLQRGVDRFFGPRLRYNTQDDTGVFEEATFQMGTGQVSRGGAERMEFLGKDRVRLTRASFTTCEPGREDWRIEARELELDYANEEGKARDMRLRFLDTTILAVPVGSFPLENRRKSGFVSPYYSHSTRRGVEVAIGYYVNIAPEQDLTLTPTYTSKRGELLKSNYRYIGRDYYGQLRYDIVPNDQVMHRTRSGMTFQHEHRILPNLTAKLDFNKVSDDRYLVDFASQVRQYSQGNLNREGSLTYGETFFGMPTYVQARVQRFQSLQDPLSPTVSPYTREPQVTFGITKTELANRLDLTLPGEYVRFTHSSLVEGTRISLTPSLALPVLAPGYFITPRVGVRTSSYDLTRTAAGQPTRQSLNVPWFSVDSGMTFERSFEAMGDGVTQTLEPRAFYVYAPYRDQRQIPVFDTGLADLNYAQLFTENRFAGADRFGDANQVTLAATTRLLNAGGQEFLRATLGQRYYFQNDRVGLTAASPLRTQNQSNIVASLGARFAQSWALDNTVLYNPQRQSFDRAGISARYAPEIAKVVSASYRYNRDPAQPTRQVDFSGQWPVQTGWYAIGRANYSFQDRRMLEGLGGLEYNGGCWVFRGVFQRIQAATQTTSTAIYLQLEFNGLGQLGSDDTVDFLKRAVPGYAITNPTQPGLVPPSMRPRLPFEQIF